MTHLMFEIVGVWLVAILLCLPLFASMSADDVARVATTLGNILGF